MQLGAHPILQISRIRVNVYSSGKLLSVFWYIFTFGEKLFITAKTDFLSVTFVMSMTLAVFEAFSSYTVN
jgi:hypothetical protein